MSHNKFRQSRGNILFLILLAVILFAALTYAVTQSQRGGGGNASKESGEAKAGTLLNLVAYYQSSMDRLEMTGGYDQVYFNDSAPNNSGTCYEGGTSRTPCRTIGLFHTSTGVTPPPMQKDFHEWGDRFWTGWTWISETTLVDGAQVKTNLPDEHIYVEPIDESTCEALNLKFNNTTTPLPMYTTSGTGGTGFSSAGIWDGSYWSPFALPSTASIEFPAQAGCIDDWGWHSFYYIIAER